MERKAESHPLIYLDNASSTPVHKEVIDEMSPFWQSSYGNPSSLTHQLGWQAFEAINVAREQVAHIIGSSEHEIIFTSGATESNNLALQGMARGLREQGDHIITSTIEHKSVLDTCKFLETQGFRLTYIPVDEMGQVSPHSIEKEITKQTILISVMYGNNEIGSLYDIHSIARIAKLYNIALHVDAAQSIGKVEINIRDFDIDLMSISSHKIHGPKGIGALFVRKSYQNYLSPIIFGGGHERGLRSGTLPVPLVVGFGKATSIAKENIKKNINHMKSMKNLLWKGINSINGVKLNGSLDESLPHILNVSFLNTNGEDMVLGLNSLALSTGSSCNTSNLDPSYVIQAISGDRLRAQSAIRFSLSCITSKDDIELAIQRIREYFI